MIIACSIISKEKGHCTIFAIRPRHEWFRPPSRCTLFIVLCRIKSSLTSHLFHLINEKWRTRQFTHIRYACPCSLVLSWHRWLQRCIYFLCAPKKVFCLQFNILTRCTWWSIGGKTYSIVSQRTGNVRIKSNQVPMMMMVWWRKSAFLCVRVHCQPFSQHTSL